MTEEDKLNESGPASSRNSTLESENDENSGFDTSLAYEPRKSTAEAVPFFKVNTCDWNEWKPKRPILLNFLILRYFLEKQKAKVFRWSGTAKQEGSSIALAEAFDGA